MKKYLSLLLTVSLLFISACNSGSENNETAETTESTAEAVLEEVLDTAPKAELSAVPGVEGIIEDMKAGWNLGNSLDAYSGAAASETAWGNPQTSREFLQSVADAGFGTVRIPVSYMGKVGNDPDYEIEGEWLDRINEVVDYALDAGLYAIINIHHDGNNDKYAWLDVSEEDQSEIRKKFKKIWEQLSERFKDYDHHLIFESMNEILEEGNYSTNVKPATYENINTLNQIFTDTVRVSGGKNTDRWLLIPGYNTNIDATMPEIGFTLPEDSAENRLMVSVHYYDPYDLCLNEQKKVYKWGLSASKGGKTTWGHEDYVDAQMQKLEEAFTSKNIPVIIGEYGIIDKTWVNEESNIYRRYYLEYFAKSAKEHGALAVYWDNGYDGNNGFSLFNRYTGEQLYPELIEAIVRGGTQKDYEIAPPEADDWGQ